MTTKNQSSASDEVKLLSALMEEMHAEKSKDTAFGIVFEGPTKAERMREENEVATPLQDSAGRSKYIVTRLCWCSLDADTDCRFHSTEPGWEVCPNRPPYHDSPNYGGTKPRQLWAINPDFGKPRERTAQPEQTTEQAPAVA